MNKTYENLKRLFEKLGDTGSLLTKVSVIQGFTAFATFITSIAIARFYNQEVLGIFAYTFAFAAYLSTLTEFGTKTSLSKMLVINPGLGLDLLKKSLLFTIPLSLTISLIALTITSKFNLNPDLDYYYPAFTLYLVALTIFSILLSIMRGYDFIISSVTFSFLNRINLLILLALLALITLNPIWVILALSLSIIVLYPCMYSKLKPQFRITLDQISYSKFIKTSVLFVFITISMFTLFFIDRILVNYLADFQQLGYYTAYYNLANIIRIISGLLPIVIIPLAVTKKYDITKSMLKLSAVILPISIIIAFVSPIAIPLIYGRDYLLTDYYLPWFLAFSSFFLLLYSYINSVLVGENPTSKFLFRIIFVDSLLSLFLPIILSLYLFQSTLMGITAVPAALGITLIIKVFYNIYYVFTLRGSQLSLQNS